MVCDSCAALSPELRRHPAAKGVAVARNWKSLAALVCIRCGASPKPFVDSTELLLETLLRLDRVGFGASAPPLLRGSPGTPATTAA